jgi:dTDP-4-dehydrorhamnose 3,5-epimerase
MTLNIIVPMGEVKFVLFDTRSYSSTNGNFLEILLSFSNYMRLTIPPNIWFGFQGCAPGNSMLLNIANIEHDPSEVDQKDINQIIYNWGE